jgi:KDO2-lipid IV(A) lauroyltransferase
VTRILVFILWLIHFLPLGAQAAIGNTLGRALYWLVGERRRVTRINLEKCFPAMDPVAREHLARAHFRAFTRSVVEHGLLWWAPRERIERLVRIEGLEHYQQNAGAPLILLVPHFVALDTGATRLALHLNAVSIYARQKNAVLNRLLRHGRSRFGDQKLLSRQEGVRGAITAMKRELRPFYYLPDQDHGPRQAVFVPFFGVPAATVPGVSRIAAIAGARVVPLTTRMLPGGAGYVMTLEPPWEDFPSGDVEADTRRVNAYIEKKALEMPEQYLWMHKRFKTRPPGEARFY